MTSSSKSTRQGEVNTAICPLCGGPNQCALAADPSATDCWCDAVVFPHELLAQIPEGAVHKTCVCQKCLGEYQDSSLDG